MRIKHATLIVVPWNVAKKVGIYRCDVSPHFHPLSLVVPIQRVFMRRYCEGSKQPKVFVPS